MVTDRALAIAETVQPGSAAAWSFSASCAQAALRVCSRS